MFELKIKTASDVSKKAVVNNKGQHPMDGHGFEVRKVLGYVTSLMELGVTSGVLSDSKGNEIGEWRYE